MACWVVAWNVSHLVSVCQQVARPEVGTRFFALTLIARSSCFGRRGENKPQDPAVQREPLHKQAGALLLLDISTCVILGALWACRRNCFFSTSQTAASLSDCVQGTRDHEGRSEPRLGQQSRIACASSDHLPSSSSCPPPSVCSRPGSGLYAPRSTSGPCIWSRNHPRHPRDPSRSPTRTAKLWLKVLYL